MSIPVNFYNFSKRHNSTAIPSAPSLTLNCSIKEESSVLTPTLQLTFNPASTNPTIYNYCNIPMFSRYYWVTDWTYISGYWEVSLKVDVLASYKTQIGNATKFVLRSSADYDRTVIDNFFPAKNSGSTRKITYDFGFTNSGDYVIGIINRDETNVGGMTTYYRVTESELEVMRRDMYPAASESFSNLSTFSGDVIRSIINPWQYIESCRKYPISIPSSPVQKPLLFGSWTQNASGDGYLLAPVANWGTITHDFVIPNWLTQDARRRTYPNCHIYFSMNPWGIIELSPMDFMSSDTARVKIKTDFITGESLLEIYSVIDMSGIITETLIAQKTALIGIDTTISAQGNNTALGILEGGIGAAAGIAVGALGGGAVGFGMAASSIANAAEKSIPSMSSSQGSTGGFRALEGVGTLTVIQFGFTNDGQELETNAEFGRPLCSSRTLSTLPGYIQCADGDISISGFDSELTEISEFLTNGFFYE